MGNEFTSSKKDKDLKLISGSIFQGEVKSHSNDSNITTVETGDGNLVKCVWAAGIFSSLLGINFNYVPPIETKVHILYTGGDISFILGSYPDESFTVPTARRTINGGEELSSETKTGKRKNPPKFPFYNSNSTPLNLVEGELEIGNAAGVAVTLLRHLSKLSAGDLAKVECFLLDDMVRIVSDTFKHVTAFGNYHIYNNNGKLNVRWDGTHRDQEAWGLKEESEESLEKFPIKEDEKNDIDLSKIDTFLDTGRWRFSNFIGQLGNFITTFVTDPQESIGKIAEESSRAGRFKFHVNADGSAIMQSVGDIILERCVRIPVPIELKRMEDPEVEIEELLGADPLASWVPDSEDTIFHTVYKLRDYARWFSNYYSLAEFHLSKGFWKVPTEDETPDPDKNCLDPDRKLVNEISDEIHAAYLDKYATIRIFRDGTILLMDTEGSAINMNNGNVYISAAKDIFYEAAGSINLIAGKDINMKAYRSIDITAITGGLLQRSEGWLQQYCSRGTILLQSNAREETEQEEEENNPRRYLDHGIVIKTEQSDILLDSNMKSKIRAMQGLETCVESFTNWIFGGLFNINETIEINGHSGFINTTTGVKAKIIAADNIMGRKLMFPTPFGGEHGNHILVKPDDGSLDPEITLEDEKLDTIKELVSGTSYTFEHRDDSEYLSGELFETLTQQKLRLDGSTDYENWTSQEDVTGLIRSDKAPWPGRNIKHLIYQPSDTTSLSEPSNNSYDNYQNKGSQLTHTNKIFKRLK